MTTSSFLLSFNKFRKLSAAQMSTLNGFTENGIYKSRINFQVMLKLHLFTSQSRC